MDGLFCWSSRLCLTVGVSCGNDFILLRFAYAMDGEELLIIYC